MSRVTIKTWAMKQVLIEALSYRKKNNGLQNLIVGLILFLLGISMAATGILVVAVLGAFLFLISLGMMFIRFIEYSRRKNQTAPITPTSTSPYLQPIIIQTPQSPSQFHSEVTREIVKGRCRSCNSLNFETSARCSNCGASL